MKNKNPLLHPGDKVRIIDNRYYKNDSPVGEIILAASKNSIAIILSFEDFCILAEEQSRTDYFENPYSTLSYLKEKVQDGSVCLIRFEKVAAISEETYQHWENHGTKKDKVKLYCKEGFVDALDMDVLEKVEEIDHDC